MPAVSSLAHGLLFNEAGQRTFQGFRKDGIMKANKRDTTRRKISPFFVWTIIASAVFLAALASPARAEEGAAGAAKDAVSPPAPSSAFLGKNPLYADIKKVDGRYVVTAVSSKPLLVRLNDLEPGVDTNRYYCTRHGGTFALEVTHPEKCKDDEKTFRKVKVDFWKTVAEDFMTIGLNLFRGNVEEVSEFDRDAYQAALEEAMTNSRLDREGILKTHDAFLVSVEAMRAASEREYLKTLKDGMAVQFPLTVEDRSGLYKNDLTAGDLVNLRANKIPAFDGKNLVFNAADTASIEKALKDLKGKYALELSQQSSFYFLDKSISARRYNIRVEAPDRIFLKDGMKQTVPLKLSVFSKTIMDVSPAYQNENSDLRIEDDGTAIIFSNKTASFIQIDTFSFYYGKYVTKNPLNLLLAPGAFVSLDRRDGRLQLPPRESYFNATRESVKEQSLSVGYNIRYSFPGEKKTRTLQKVETHQVCDLLS